MFGTCWDWKKSIYKQETTGLKIFPILAPKICLKYPSPKTKKIYISHAKLHQIYKSTNSYLKYFFYEMNGIFFIVKWVEKMFWALNWDFLCPPTRKTNSFSFQNFARGTITPQYLVHKLAWNPVINYLSVSLKLSDSH